MKYITWNMQGATGFGESKWSTTVRSLFNELNVDVICLQECGMPPSTALDFPFPGWIAGGAPPMPWAYLQWNMGTRSRPNFVYIFWVQCDQGANRNNLAIVSKQVANGAVVVYGGMPNARPAIGIQLYTDGTAVNIYSIHAFSGGGGNAPALLNNINTVGQPWFALGDYNRSPESWAHIILPPGTNGCPHNGYITHPSSGTNLDYAFINPANSINGVVIDTLIASDHYPVGYEI